MPFAWDKQSPHKKAAAIQALKQILSGYGIFFGLNIYVRMWLWWTLSACLLVFLRVTSICNPMHACINVRIPWYIHTHTHRWASTLKQDQILMTILKRFCPGNWNGHPCINPRLSGTRMCTSSSRRICRYGNYDTFFVFPWAPTFLSDTMTRTHETVNAPTFLHKETFRLKIFDISSCVSPCLE